MQRKESTPAGLDLQSPGRRDYWVVLPAAGKSPYRIPLTVIAGPGAGPGKGLVAFGGTHGDEYEGPLAIKRFMGEIRTEQVAGRIILVPVLNAAAFAVGARESTADDGFNLNRLFVPDRGGEARNSITCRIADLVREIIWPHVHIVIDIHSGGEIARIAHEVSFTPVPDREATAEREQIARWSGAPFVVRRGGVGESGLLIDDAERRGKMAFGSELGWGGTADPQGIRYARQCVAAAAIRHGLLRGTIEPIGCHADGSQRLVERRGPVSAPFDGHYEPLIGCGEPVSAGQTVGYMHDFARVDEKPLAMVAPAGGYAVSQARGARVKRGQTLVGIAREVRR